MEWENAALTLILGVLLRFGLPVAATGLLVWWLRRLDERWKDEGKREMGARARNTGCWELNRCPEEKRAGCAAFANPDLPCWQIFRDRYGRLQESCLDCGVFRGAPSPA